MNSNNKKQDMLYNIDHGKIQRLVRQNSFGKLNVVQYLHKNVILAYIDKLHPLSLSRYQKLDYELIKLLSDKLDWYYISKCQKLDIQTILEFEDKIDWRAFTRFQKMDADIMKQFLSKMNKNDLFINPYIDQNLVKNLYEQYGDLL
jgi:hypothetical protein